MAKKISHQKEGTAEQVVVEEYSVVFSEEDVALFSRASRDRNPLHLSDGFARKTAFGERVVFGVLAGLSCIDKAIDLQGQAVDRISLEFIEPVYIGQEYNIAVRKVSGKSVLFRLLDGSRILLKGDFLLSDVENTPDTIEEQFPELSIRNEARILAEQDLQKGLLVEGHFGMDVEGVARLISRYPGLRQVPRITSCLAACSYLVGMEVPGKQALFSKVQLELSDHRWQGATPITYKYTLESYEPKINLLRSSCIFTSGEEKIGAASIESFFRLPAQPAETNKVYSSESIAFEKKVAFISGASRGLGAALCRQLVIEGCTVFLNYLKSTEEAVQIKKELEHAAGRVILMQGDVSDPVRVDEMKTQILNDYGKLDILVSNACLPIRPFRMEKDTVTRVNRYLAQSFALVSIPLSTFGELLEKEGGWHVAISSSAVETIPEEWPHYVSAKLAIEGLVKTFSKASKEMSTLIVRPPKF